MEDKEKEVGTEEEKVGEEGKSIEGEIVSTSMDDLLSMKSEMTVEEVVALAKAKVEALRQVWALAVSRTTNRDWVNMSDNPYLTASGAEKIMSVFGVCIYDVKKEKLWSEDEKGGKYYIWEYAGKATWAGGSMQAIGTRSSKDKFFAYDRYSKTYKPLSEVDECNIMKSAYTNMEINLITRLLGLRGLKWEDLAEMGIRKEAVSSVEYKGKSVKAESGTSKEVVGKCEVCGEGITESVKSYSMSKFKKGLCFKCQKKQ